MLFPKFIFGLFFLFSLAVQANEGEEEKGTSTQQQSYSGKQDQKWEAVLAEVTALKGKMENQATIVQNLITEKSSLTGKPLQEKMEQIKFEHQKYERFVFEYNSKNEEFLTRYPDRGLKEKRVYRRVKMKSLDSFEDDVTIRGRMNKLHNKVLKQYPKAFSEDKNKKESSASTEASKSASDDVTNSIKLKK